MTPSHPSDEDAHDALAAARELQAKAPQYLETISCMLTLNRRQRDALTVVVKWSYQIGKEWAVFRSVAAFGMFCGLQRTHASRVLDELKNDKHVLERETLRGVMRLRFLPDGVLVAPPVRVDPRKMAAVIEDHRRLNSVPDGYDFDGRQKLLPLPKPVEEETGDDQAAESRRRGVAALRAWNATLGAYQKGTPAEAEAASERTKKVRPYQKGTPGEAPERTKKVRLEQKSPDFGAEERTKKVRPYQKGTPENADLSIRRAPASEHVHVPDHGTQSMYHEHARRVAEEAGFAGDERKSFHGVTDDELEAMLDEESAYAFSVILEITGGMTRKWHRVWLMRLNDRWKECALRAIGEIKMKKIEGEKPRVGWGEWANFYFEENKKRARKAPATKE